MSRAYEHFSRHRSKSDSVNATNFGRASFCLYLEQLDSHLHFTYLPCIITRPRQVSLETHDQYPQWQHCPSSQAHPDQPCPSCPKFNHSSDPQYQHHQSSAHHSLHQHGTSQFPVLRLYWSYYRLSYLLCPNPRSHIRGKV